MKAQLFTSFGVSDLETQINEWIKQSEKEYRAVDIDDILFSPSSPENGEQKFALLFTRPADIVRYPRVRLFDSGVRSIEDLTAEIDQWLDGTDVNRISTKQVLVPASAFAPARVYIIVLYTS